MSPTSGFNLHTPDTGVVLARLSNAGTVQLQLCMLRLPETVSVNMANYCIMNNASLWKSHL